MPRPFFPGSIDYDGPMAREFNSGRGVSSHSMSVWRAALEPYIGNAGNVLDHHYSKNLWIEWPLNRAGGG